MGPLLFEEMFGLVLPGFVIGRWSSPRWRGKVYPRTPSLRVNVLSAVLVGRFSGDRHWPVLGDRRGEDLGLPRRPWIGGQSVSILHNLLTDCPLSGSGSRPMCRDSAPAFDQPPVFSVPGHALSVRPAACNEKRVDGSSRGRRIVTSAAGARVNEMCWSCGKLLGSLRYWFLGGWVCCMCWQLERGKNHEPSRQSQNGDLRDRFQ